MKTIIIITKRTIIITIITITIVNSLYLYCNASQWSVPRVLQYGTSIKHPSTKYSTKISALQKAEVYSEPNQTSEMDLFMKKVLMLNANNQYLALNEEKNFMSRFRSSPPEVFLGKGVLEIHSKFTGKHSCRSANSIKLYVKHWNCTSAWVFSSKFEHIFRPPFSKNTYGELLLKISHRSNNLSRFWFT